MDGRMDTLTYAHTHTHTHRPTAITLVVHARRRGLTTEEPTADKASTESRPTPPWILALGIFIITLPTGFVAGIIVMILWHSKRKQRGTGGEQTNTLLYE